MKGNWECDSCHLEVELTGPQGWWGHKNSFFDAPCGRRLMDRYCVLPYPDEDDEEGEVVLHENAG